MHEVTTNHAIIARDGLTTADLPRLYERFERAGAREIFMQVTDSSIRELAASAARVAEFGSYAIVKVPATLDGFRAAQSLRS